MQSPRRPPSNAVRFVPFDAASSAATGPAQLQVEKKDGAGQNVKQTQQSKHRKHVEVSAISLGRRSRQNQ
jgi:hypothetical protein